MSLTTISTFTPAPPIQLASGSTATLRGWYSQRYLDSDGVTPVLAGDGQDGFYYEWDCTVDGDGNLVVPEIEIHTTDDGVDIQTSRFTGRLFIDGASDRIIFGQPESVGGWIISATLGASTTWGALDVYNQGRALAASNLYTYLTAALTAALIQQMAILAVSTTEPVQLGDYDNEGNGSYFKVSDEEGVVVFQAGGAGGDQYAGFTGEATDDDSTIYVQTTNYTHLLGTSSAAGDGVVKLGDALEENQGTQVRIDDAARMVMSCAANAVPDDAKINAEEISFYLDQSGTKLKARIRLSDGTYATWEGTYVPD